MSAAYENALARRRAPLPPRPDRRDLLRVATLSASGHNTQPWLFRSQERSVRIEPDFGRRTPVVDPDDHHLWASLGCAAETLAIAARARGLTGEVAFEPWEDAGRIRVALEPTPIPASRHEAALVEAIPVRQCTRRDYDGRPAPVDAVARMVAAAALHDVDLVWIAEPRAVADVTELVLAGNAAQVRDRAFKDELSAWIRYSEREALARGDGLFALCTGNPALPRAVGAIAFRLVFREGPERDKVARQIRSSAGIAVLVARAQGPEGFVAAGRAYQRLALQATVDGLAHAFVAQCVEVPAQRAALAAHLGLGERRPNLAIRIGRAEPMPYSLRRPVEDVIVEG